MSRMSDKLFDKLLIPLLITVLTPIAAALGSKIVSGSWTEWIEKVPIPAWRVFGIAMLLWVVVLVYKRLKAVRESEIGHTTSVVIPPYGWTEVGELEHAGVLWTVCAPAPEPWETFDPMSVSSSELNIAIPPKCPKCGTELEEKPRFFGGYKWKCIRCGFKKRNKDKFDREERRALKLAKSDWESHRRSRSRKIPIQESPITPAVEAPRSREKTMRSSYSLHLFVATPCDVAAERDRLALIVRDLNNAFTAHGLTLKLLDWRDVVPDLGRPEDVILDQLPVEKWDIFVGVLWARFGTPPGREDPETGKPFLSGTEEEFTLACRSWRETGKPRILFYRCKCPITPDRLDSEQFALVQKFFDGFKPGGEHPGLPQEYETVEDFERRVRQDLLKLLLEYSRDQGQAGLESEVDAKVRMLEEEQRVQEEKAGVVVQCGTSRDIPVPIPPQTSTEPPQGEPTTPPKRESFLKKVSLPVWFMIGATLTLVIVLFFVRPLRCLLEYHITEAQVTLLALLAGGLAAAITLLLPPHTRKALLSFYSGVAVILVLFIIVVWLSSPIPVGECSTPTPTPTLIPTPVRLDDAIYQDGEIVARVSGDVAVEQSQGRIRFKEIYNSNSLDLKSEFEFQKWRLVLRGYESFTGLTIELIAGPDGPSQIRKENVFGNVECEVVGERQ